MELKTLTIDDLITHYGDRLPMGEQVRHELAAVRVRILLPEGLRSRVVGARAYTVVIRDEAGQMLTACTCPYHLDHANDCKHIIATLLAWVVARESFKPTPEWCRPLAAKTRDEMLAILLDMCEAHPQILEEYGLVEMSRERPSS